MKITDEQLETACDAMEEWSRDKMHAYMGHRSVMKMTLEAAAPHLQIPWSDPTQGEMLNAWNSCAERAPMMLVSWKNVIREFVDGRNFSMKFSLKYSDPRRAAVLNAIRNRDWPLDIERELKLVDGIIAALDEAGQ